MADAGTELAQGITQQLTPVGNPFIQWLSQFMQPASQPKAPPLNQPLPRIVPDGKGNLINLNNGLVVGKDTPTASYKAQAPAAPASTAPVPTPPSAPSGSGWVAKLVDTLFPHQERGVGLRPQSDEMTRMLMNALRGAGGGVNQAGTGVSPAQIVQAALFSPGTIEARLQPQVSPIGKALGQQTNVSTRGEVPIQPDQLPTGPRSQLNVYPETFPGRNTNDMTNVLLHELIHAMRVNKGLDKGGTGKADTGMEEALAYYGSGTPLAAVVGQMQGGLTRIPEVEQNLSELVAGIPPTTPQDRPLLPVFQGESQ